MMLNPAKYILKVDTNSDPGAIDDFCDDIQYLDEKKEIAPDNVEPLYEELKKIYDWNEDETKVKPRIKGDQRTYQESYDKVDPIDRVAGEPFKDQVEPPQVHDDPTKTLVSSPNLSPLLLVYTGSGKSEIGERTYPVVSSGRHESHAANVSRSNYFALKSTDDMFKGGSEQSNSTGEKLRGPSAIGTTGEWQTQKVSGVRNGGAKGKDAVSWSLTGQKQYIDTDSRSPYENRKYLESQVPRGWEHVQNIDRVKQTIVSSKDLHESFVEPLEWIDDFDKDIRVRLSRSLKTVDSNTLAYIESSTTKYEKSPVNGFIDRAPIENGTTLKTEDSTKVALVSHPPLDIQQLFQDDRRTKREVGTLYDTYDDDEDRRNRDSERMDDYDLYSSDKEKTSDNFQLLNAYDDTDDENQELFNSKDVEEYDYLDDDEDDYGGIVRNADSKRKEHAVKKKSYGKALKKGKRKIMPLSRIRIAENEDIARTKR
uniref:LOW QUALITY PROTEIN: chromatin-remodeling ATPase INO80-like n=1 Tax=Bombus vancouverensis nearcticus TaxID=2705178 RepID=UPI00143C3A3A|nr:LOW QUALITY PROTEIN: chromatin-remodeling ATPase INO80-like [Bombus vancouverensis nearcticus]